MKRIARCLFIVFLAALPQFSAAQQNAEPYSTNKASSLVLDLTQEEKNWLATRSGFKVGSEVDWPPFQFTEHGEAKGYSIDLLRLAGQKVGLEFESVSGPSWSQLMAMLRNGEIDILPAIAKTKERSEFISFTSAYMSGPVVLVSQENDNSVRNISDLNGKRLAIVDNYYYEAPLRRSYPDVTLLPVAGLLEGLNAVINGDADAFIGNQTVIDTLVRQHFLSGLQIVGQTGIEDVDRFSFHMGVAKKQNILAAIIDKGIRAITQDENQVLYDRWLGFGMLIHDQIESAHLTDNEQAFIKAHPTVRASNDLNWAPINFVDNGLPAGFSVEYLKLVAAKVGIKLEFVSGEWDELMQQALKKELDVMLNIIKNEPRSKYLRFTKPYANSPMAIFSRSEDQPLKNIKDLFGKRVAIGKGFFSYRYLAERYPQIELIPVHSTLDGLKAVSIGKADAVLDRLAVGNYLIAYNFINNVVPTGTSGIDALDKADWRFGVRKDWPELAAILEKGMNLVSGEEFSTLVRKWYLYGAPIDQPVVNLNKEEKVWLKAHPVIRVSSEADYYPFDFRINEKPSGYSIDYVELLAERLGIRIEYVRDTWDNLLKKTQNKEIDLIHSIFNYPADRERYLHFSKPYKAVFTAIIVREDTTDIRSVADLAERKVAVIKGDSVDEALKVEHPNAENIPYDQYSDALRAVSFGSVDAFVTELPVASYYIRSLSLTNLKIAAEAPRLANRDQRYRLAVRKDWQPLIPILEKAMDTLTADELKLLDDRWVALPDASNMKSLQLSAKEKAWLTEHPKLSFGYDIEQPPISFTDNDGLYSGVTADIFAHIKKLLGVELEPLSPRSWAEMLDAAKQGNTDIISALVFTKERGKFLNFTSPYLKIPTVIVTRKEESFIVDIKELQGKQVAVVKNDYSHELLKTKHPDFELLVVNDAQEGLLAVNQKRAFAFVGGLAVAGHVIGHSGLKEVQVSGETPYHYDIAIGTRKGEPILAGLMQKALDAIPQEERNAIFRKWFSVTYEHEVDYALIWQLLFAVILIFLAFLFWNRKLSGMNQALLFAKEGEQTARLAAESANTSKSTFLANMSHELRTPLNAILGFSQIMQNKKGRSEDDRQTLDIINRSGDYLLQLINDILDMSKIEAGQMGLETEDLDLTTLVRDVIDIIRVRAEAKGLKLVVEQSAQFPRYIHGDSAKLRQIFINLLSNAVKFTDTGKVTLHLDAEESPNKHITLLCKVQDSGSGIDEVNSDRIFLPFEQLEGSSTQQGTGLGLSITRQFVELMNGSIMVENKPEGGAIFKFNVHVQTIKDPVIPDPTHHLQKVICLEPDQGEFRILVAEDQYLNQLLLKTLLISVGFNVRVADNGLQAVELFEEWHPHFIWMDLRMPVMNGMTAIQQIRSLPAGDQVKISFLTASALRSQMMDSLEKGADDVLYKPYKQEDIFSCMAKHIGVRYLYEQEVEKEEADQRNELTSEAFKQIPSALKQSLYDAAVELDIEHLNALTHEVRVLDPELAKGIQQAIDNFDLEALQESLFPKAQKKTLDWKRRLR